MFYSVLYQLDFHIYFVWLAFSLGDAVWVLSRRSSQLNWKCFVQKTVVCDTVNTQHVFEATTSHSGEYAAVL